MQSSNIRPYLEHRAIARCSARFARALALVACSSVVGFVVGHIALALIIYR